MTFIQHVCPDSTPGAEQGRAPVPPLRLQDRLTLQVPENCEKCHENMEMRFFRKVGEELRLSTIIKIKFG